MTAGGLEELFTHEQPLGPIAVSDHTHLAYLRALYEPRVNLHVQSEHNPPTFIVGRRGSGKTSLLLSREFDKKNMTIRLSTAELFGHVQVAVNHIEAKTIVPVELIARLWDLIFWAPIAVRLAERGDDKPSMEQQILWEETAELRRLKAHGLTTRDDAIVGFIAERLVTFIESHPGVRTVDAISASFRLKSRQWSQVVESCQAALKQSKTPVYILIDSLEDTGSLIARIGPSLKGLFHLIGQNRLAQSFRYYRLQCCFPSEMWPLLSEMSSNPVKDFAGKLVLHWRWRDLMSACDSRLRTYLEMYHPARLPLGDPTTPGRSSLEALLPPTVVSRTGRVEDTFPYILRHTQLLPRQVIFVLNECFARAIAESGEPHVTRQQVVDAVTEVEATLCPEVFSAHAFRYQSAQEVSSRIVPRLPFRFSEGALHKAYNKSGCKELGLGYSEVRQMLSEIGVIGRMITETDRYITAEFAYTVEGRLILSPEDELCLHPLFVRQYSSADLVPGKVAPKPVYPVGVPARVA